MEITGSLSKFLPKPTNPAQTRPQTSTKFLPCTQNPKKTTLADLFTHQHNKKNSEFHLSNHIYQTPSRCTFRAASVIPKQKHSKPNSKSPTRSETSNLNSSIHSSLIHQISQKKKSKVSVSLQEQVRNELLLKNKHYIIRSMKKIMRSEERNEEGGERVKDTLFVRLAKRFEDTKVQVNEKEGKGKEQTEYLIQKMSVVKEKEIVAERRSWLKKHGFLGQSEDIDFAKTVFHLLQQNGEIKSGVFINLLASIGVPLPIYLIQSTLSRVFKPVDPENYVIYERSLMSLCKTDEFERNTLSVFVHALVALGKRPINSVKNPLTHIYKVILSSHDISQLIKDWWTELDSMHLHQIHINKVSEFLNNKSIVADTNERRKYLRKFKFESNFIDFAQFLKIFAKFIVKNSLKALCFRLEGNVSDSEYFSKDYTLTLMKKKLIFAGIRYPVTEFSAEEGASAIENIKKISNFEEFTDFDQYKALRGKTSERKEWSEEKMDKKEKREMAVVYWSEGEREEILEMGKEVKEFVEKNKACGVGNVVSGMSEGKWKHSIPPKFLPFVVQRV